MLVRFSSESCKHVVKDGFCRFQHGSVRIFFVWRQLISSCWWCVLLEVSAPGCCEKESQLSVSLTMESLYL